MQLAPSGRLAPAEHGGGREAPPLREPRRASSKLLERQQEQGALLRALQIAALNLQAARQATQHASSVAVSAKYDSRSDVLRTCVAGNIGQWLRFKATEGPLSRIGNRLSLTPEYGPLRLRWDACQAALSLGLTLHSSDTSLLQFFHDFQGPAQLNSGLMLGRWSACGQYKCFSSLRLPAGQLVITGRLPACFYLWRFCSYRSSIACIWVGWHKSLHIVAGLTGPSAPHCCLHVQDLLWVDFPNGDLWYHRHRGWKGSFFARAPHGGMLQFQAQWPGSARLSTSHKVSAAMPLLGVGKEMSITAGVVLPERSLELDIVQPLLWETPVLRGRHASWLAEGEHYLGNNAMLQLGCRSGIETTAFGSFTVGKHLRAKLEQERGSQLKLGVETPLEDWRRLGFSIEWNHRFPLLALEDHAAYERPNSSRREADEHGRGK
eukprot:SM000112S23982  [mRNA]  locus=s112:145943:149013:- [translate_table: standard]